RLLVYDVPARKHHRTLQVENKSNLWGPAAFSPDSKTLALAVGNATVHLWDVATGERRAVLRTPARDPLNFSSLGFSPDGRRLLVAEQNLSNLHILDLEKLKAVGPGPGGEAKAGAGTAPHAVLKLTGKVQHLAYSPDGQTLTTVCEPGNAYRYDTA